MSDLVGNPEDRFSHDAAQKCISWGMPQTIYEPVHEKTNNLGFRPGPTQTRLYSHRSRLEA